MHKLALILLVFTLYFDPAGWEDGGELLDMDRVRMVIRVYKASNPAKTWTVVGYSKPGADNVTLPNQTKGTYYYYKFQRCLDNNIAWCSDNSALHGELWRTGPKPATETIK